MNKSELKAMWGRYADTDKMVDDIMELLTTYGHRNSEHGVCKMLHTFFVNKEPLIRKFIISPHYVGDLRIELRQEFARSNNARDVEKFCYSFESNIGAKEIILSRVDENGKTMIDHMLTGTKRVEAKKLHDAKFVGQLKSARAGLIKFNDGGYTRKSYDAANTFHRIMIDDFSRFSSPSLSSSNVESIHNHDSNLKLVSGLKTSRAFNRVCEAYGVTKAEKYNKLFAQYADLVSDLKRELDFYISLNPYDYLTMSFGNSWASCHTIDKQNRRQSPDYYSGGYCGGTLSYMLDSTSIITFAIDKGADVQQSGKIYRNMFHYGNNMLMQSRVYPQANDGSTDLYKSFRDIVQAEFATILGLTNNDWIHLGGRKTCENKSKSYGVHYKDYIYNDGCNLSYPSEKDSFVNDSDRITIGHTGVCPYCGEEINSSSALSHSSCIIWG